MLKLNVEICFQIADNSSECATVHGGSSVSSNNSSVFSGKSPQANTPPARKHRANHQKKLSFDFR